MKGGGGNNPIQMALAIFISPDDRIWCWLDTTYTWSRNLDIPFLESNLIKKIRFFIVEPQAPRAPRQNSQDHGLSFPDGRAIHGRFPSARHTGDPGIVRESAR